MYVLQADTQLVTETYPIVSHTAPASNLILRELLRYSCISLSQIFIYIGSRRFQVSC